MRDRRINDPAAETPFDHQHYGEWVQMDLAASSEDVRDGVVRRTRTYVCPSCSYELTENEPVAISASPGRES